MEGEVFFAVGCTRCSNRNLVTKGQVSEDGQNYITVTGIVCPIVTQDVFLADLSDEMRIKCGVMLSNGGHRGAVALYQSLCPACKTGLEAVFTVVVRMLRKEGE
jgi:hypothetical protein